jgi:DTW domain-containing protein YfiP
LIYPNPASDELTVSITDLPEGKTMLLKLIDATGSTLQETRTISHTKIYQLKYNTSTLPKGIYLVQICVGEQLLSKKIVIQ